MGSKDPNVVDADMSGIFDDPTFNNLSYDNYGASDSPFDTARLFDLSAADSPDFRVRTPSKSGLGLENDISSLSQHQQQPPNPHSAISSRSAESSSQDSSSESSSRRKRNTTSESPPAEHMAGLKMENVSVNPGDTMLDMNNYQSLQSFGRDMNNLSLEQDFASNNAMNTHFDFESAASSPGVMNPSSSTYTQSSLNTAMRNTQQGPPAGTVEPAHFFLGSNAASPVSTKDTRTADASPMYANPQFDDGWTGAGTVRDPSWNNDYSNAFSSPGALGLTPSPTTNETPRTGQDVLATEGDRIPLHLGPIPAKSRVETQINIRMTLDRLPPGIKLLHLPTHTIAKAKLLAKELVTSQDSLELHTMLVCTSAMNQPHLRERALHKAASKNNSDIQARGEAGTLVKKEDEELDEEDKPSEGGEVRICQNCINRERKRAARKKLKKEEEQAHWEKYETERVIVFNTNEHKPFQEWQPSPAVKDQNVAASELYPPTETAMQVTAPMRIACYCRHQNEKDGFQVIFTMKDYQGKVVAQQISDSILITDDHKTHPGMPSTGSQIWYDGSQFSAGAPFTSQSMVDLTSHMPSMSMSKSTGNLQGLSFNNQVSNFTSGTTSATMTPRNLSRPASPTGLQGAGPSKKRKSSSAHRRMPSGLAMTRVDAGSAAPTFSPFSPTSAPFNNRDQSFTNLSQYHTNPPTPNEGTSAMPFGALNRSSSLDQTGFQAFYSAPSSAHQSRAPSPVLQGPNLAAYHRQQMHNTNNNMPIRTNQFAVSQTSLTGTGNGESDRQAPIINKVTPSEGPTSGGIEVSIYGSGFTPGMDVMFGDRHATATTFWGEKALCCVLPPGPVEGAVTVTIVSMHHGHSQTFSSPHHAQLFRYTNDTPDSQMMEMALRFYSQKLTGTPDRWQAMAQEAANAFVQRNSSAMGRQAGGVGGAAGDGTGSGGGSGTGGAGGGAGGGFQRSGMNGMNYTQDNSW